MGKKLSKPNFLSQEDIRNQRLGRYDQQQNESALEDINARDPAPVSVEVETDAQRIHRILEDLLLNTFHASSLDRNPDLKLLQSEENAEIKTYTLENIDQVIIKIMELETYHSESEKYSYLIDLYRRLEALDKQEFLSVDRARNLQKTVLECLIKYLTSISDENSKVLTDCSRTIYDMLGTQQPSAINKNEFLKTLIINIPEKQYDMILTPIFKRMVHECSENTMTGRRKILKSITMLQELLKCNKKIADFLLNHELFIPQKSHPTGLDYQHQTIFGVFLSFTVMNNDSVSLYEDIQMSDLIHWEQSKPSKQSLQDKIHENINSVHNLINFIIKLDQKFKTNIIDWFHGVTNANKAMQKCSSKSNDELATHGWFCNFLVLLLKLCPNAPEDSIESFTKWSTKIDLSYIYSSHIFEDQPLLNGEIIPKAQNHVLESNVKFSFLTELIFTTTFAWSLMRDIIHEFREFLRTIKKMQKANKSGNSSFFQRGLDLVRTNFAASVQLFDSYLMDQMLRLLNFQVLLILRAYHINVETEDVSSIFEQFQLDQTESSTPVLEFWALNVLKYLNHFTIFEYKVLLRTFSDLNLNILMNFVLALATNKLQTTHTDLRSASVGLLCRFAKNIRRGFLDPEFILIFQHSPFYKNHLMNTLINLFVDPEPQQIYTYSSSMPEKYNTKTSSLIIFNDLLESAFINNTVSSYLIDDLKKLINNTDQYLMLVDLLMNNMMAQLEKLCSKSSESEEGIIEIISSENKEEISKSESAVRALKHLYIFAVNISKYCPEFFLNELVRDRFVSCLNESLKIFNEEERLNEMKKVIQDSRKKLTAETLLGNLMRVYINLSHDDEFVQSVLGDNCELEYFQTFKCILEGKNMFSDIEREKLDEMMATIESLIYHPRE